MESALADANIEAALERGIAPRILRLPGIGLDIDRPEDLAAFLASGSGTCSHAYLDCCNVSARLRAANVAAPRAAHERN